MAFDPSRGSMYEYAKAKNDCTEFKQSLKRQLPWSDWTQLYERVEKHCRAYRPFAGKPYKDWLGVLQAVWSRALAGELSAPLPFTAEQLNYAGKAAVAHFLAQDPTQHITVGTPLLDKLMTKETTMKGKKVRVPKPPKKTYNTCGVRFLRGHNLHKVYTYKVPKKVKLRLGEEIVVPSLVDGYEANSIAVVVELHATPQDIHGYDYKFVTGRITPVKA